MSPAVLLNRLRFWAYKPRLQALKSRIEILYIGFKKLP